MPLGKILSAKIEAAHRGEPDTRTLSTSGAGIVRITAKRRHWTKNVERLCGTEQALRGEGGGTVLLEIFAAIEMTLLIEMIVYG